MGESEGLLQRGKRTRAGTILRLSEGCCRNCTGGMPRWANGCANCAPVKGSIPSTIKIKKLTINKALVIRCREGERVR